MSKDTQIMNHFDFCKKVGEVTQAEKVSNFMSSNEIKTTQYISNIGHINITNYYKCFRPGKKSIRL